MIIRIALDGSLTRSDMGGGPLVLRDGAREGVLSLFRAGHELVLRTPRLGPDASRFPEQDIRAFLKTQGLLGCFARIEGESYADLDFVQRSVRVGDADEPWQAVAESYGDGGGGGDVGDSEWPRLLLFRRIGAVSIYVVDGPDIRDNEKMVGQRNRITDPWDPERIPFAEGGNASHYRFVPREPLQEWVDSANAWEEQVPIASHETFEDAGMDCGVVYSDEADDGAHDYASIVEGFGRSHPGEPAEAVLVKCCGFLETVRAMKSQTEKARYWRDVMKPWALALGRTA